MKRTCKFSLLLFLSLGFSALAQDRIRLKDGTTLAGKASSNSDGTITFTAQNGATKIIVPTNVDKMDIKKPSDMTSAEALFNAGNYAAAAQKFQLVIDKYRNLQWDVSATALKAKCHIQLGQGDEATKAYDILLAQNPTARDNPVVRGGRWEALIAAGRGSIILNEIEKAITTGTRREAAVAQMRRGDINMNKKLYEDAVLDYLRTVYYFQTTDQEVLAEATFKAAEALKANKDSRAEKLYKKVAEEFPSSVWAGRVKK